MKALKEKRLSLRSFLRRGLVILSLFALAFASCADTDTGGGGGGGGGGVEPPPAAPTVKSITISAQPTKPSFQGLGADLTGVVLEVVWDNGNKEYISDLAGNGFYVAPPYCDIPGTASAIIGKFYIAHRGSTAFSDDLLVPGVIPIKTLHLTSKAPYDWYADQRPDFSNFVLQGYYEWKDSDPYNASAVADKSATKDIPMNVSYPPIDTKDLATKKLITVNIGKNSTKTTDLKTAEISVANYYLVADIGYAGAVGEFFAFDDDTKYAGLGAASGTETARNAMLTYMGKAKPNFNVTYTDGKPAKTISWDEFSANVYYTYGKLGSNVTNKDFFFGDDGTGYPATAASPDRSQLAWNDDDYTWTFVLKYVPKEYGNETYRGVVSVPLPVFEFSGINPAAKKYPGAQNVLTEFVATDTGMTSGLLKGIQDNWVLTGVYERSGQRQTKEIGITSNMFQQVGGATNTTVNLRGDGTLSGIVSANASGTLSAGTTAFERNWPLPLVYRGEVIDSDDTVQVDLFYRW